MAKGGRDDAPFEQLSALNNELVALQRELAKKRARLQHLVELKNQFLAMVSHDLSKPIGAVISYSEFLMEALGESVDDEQRRFLEVIHTAGWRMRDLTDDFLDMALMESPRLELRLEPTTIAEVVNSAMDVIAPLATKYNLNLQTRLGAELPQVIIDAAKVEQALINLLGNAVDHCGPGTRVVIGAAHDDFHVHLSVTDDGPGIDPARHATLFELGGGSSKLKHTGERSTGLGLPIVKRIAEAHRGSLTVETMTPTGTRFLLSLPITQETSP